MSHSDFSLTLQNAEKLLHEGSCSRRAMLSCDCPTCRSPSKLSQSHELELQKDVTVQSSTAVRVTDTNSMSMNSDYELVEKSEAKAEKEELIESVNNQMTGKPEIKTANIGHCNMKYIPFLLLSCLLCYIFVINSFLVHI